MLRTKEAASVQADSVNALGLKVPYESGGFIKPEPPAL